MFDYIQSRLPQLRERLKKYESLYQRTEVPAKTILLKEGAVSKKAFYIEKGCLRIWFNNNGIDTSFQFAFEGNMVSSAESFRKNTPSLFTVEAIEPTILHVLSKRNYESMMKEMSDEPAFLQMIIESLFDRQVYYMKEFLSFVRDTPQQRYEHLMNERPHILQRVPQHYIASYLGITPVHLSRVRNKLLKEKKGS